MDDAVGHAPDVRQRVTPRARATRLDPARPRTAPPKRKPGPDLIRHILKPIVWIGALTPLAILVYRTFFGSLGVNPVETLTHWTGFTALTILMVTLGITPIRRITRWNHLVKLRRPIGLFAFFYVCIHLLIYMLFDHKFSIPGIVEDIVERPYITVGFASFVLLLPLAATSTRAMIRRLGSRWQKLHYLIYPAATLGVLHFFWKEKRDTSDPEVFAYILLGLLLVRVPFVLKDRRRKRARRSSTPTID